MSTVANLHSSQEAGKILDLTEGRIRQICRWSREQSPLIGQKIGRDWFLTDADLELVRIKFPKKSSDSEESD